MISIVIFAFVMFGITYTIGHSIITRPIREALFVHPIGKIIVMLLECPGCLGFHLGWIAYVIDLAPDGLVRWLPGDTIIEAICVGFFTMTTNLMIARGTGILSAAGGEEETKEKEERSK